LQMPSAKTSTIVDRPLKDKWQLVGKPSTLRKSLGGTYT